MALLAEDDKIRITVNGVASGQAIKNVLWYNLDALVGAIDSSLIVAAFQTSWQASVIPVLSDSYEVASYMVERFSLLTQKPPTVPPTGIKPRLRFNVKHKLLGTGADQGDVAGAALPTYVAAAYTRNSNGPQDTEYMPPSPSPGVFAREKQFRSSMRLGPLPETYTEAAAQNDLTDAAVAALEDIGTDLMTFNVASGANTANFDMVIPSVWQDGLLRSCALADPDFVMAFQIVDSMVLQPLVTSQVSRKQRSGGD
jgi:hypothetical protein